MIHICFITNEFPTLGQSNGGIGTMVKVVGEYLAANGIRVSVLGEYSSVGYTEENGVHVYRIPKVSGRLQIIKRFFAINYWLRFLHKKNAINFIETPELGLFLLLKIKDVRYVIRMHGGHHFFAKSENRPTEWKKALIEKISFSKSDAVLAVSNYVKDSTLQLLGKKLEVNVIFNPVNTQQFKVNPDFPVVSHRIVFVGSVVEKKGIRQLVMAMPHIRARFPSAHLVVVGRMGLFPGTKDPYFPYLQTFLPPDYSDFITFTGAVPHEEVVNYISSAQVCVYPSHMEALPLAWLEALGMGKPFVGGQTGPGIEVVKHGVTGLLADPFSPEDIASKVLELFDDPEYADQMGFQAMEDVKCRFDIQVVGPQNLAYYQNLMEA